MPQLSVATHANLPVFRSIAEVEISDYRQHTTTLDDHRRRVVTLTDRRAKTVTLDDFVPEEE